VSQAAFRKPESFLEKLLEGFFTFHSSEKQAEIYFGFSSQKDS
jgi:hypothetical protein